MNADRGPEIQTLIWFGVTIGVALRRGSVAVAPSAAGGDRCAAEIGWLLCSNEWIGARPAQSRHIQPHARFSIMVSSSLKPRASVS